MTTLEKAKRVRTAWFQIQNRISEYLNEHVRPKRASRIELVDVEDSSKSSRELLGFIARSFLELADARDDSMSCPFFCFAAGKSSGLLGEPWGGDVIDWQLADYVRVLKEIGVDKDTWDRSFVAPIAQHIASVNDWFEQLERDTEDSSPPAELLADLTQGPRALLSYLWRNSPCTRDDLHNHVWRKPVQDGAIDKAAERLNQNLAVHPKYSHIYVEKSRDYFKLHRDK